MNLQVRDAEVGVETEVEEVEETKMEADHMMHLLRRAMILTTQTLKVEGEDRDNNMISPTLNASSVTILVIIILNVTLNCRKTEKEEKSNFVEKQEAETFLMECHIKEEANQNLWYLDTCYNNHMCGNKDVFSILNESFRTTVRFGDNSIISMIGKGDIQIRTTENTL